MNSNFRIKQWVSEKVMILLQEVWFTNILDYM